MSPVRFASAIARRLGLTVAPPVQSSHSRHDATRARLSVTALEDRTVPTPVVTIEALAHVTEGGGATAAFRLTRTETSGSLSIGFSPTGTATSGMDYTYPLFVTFADGAATADVVITPSNDTMSEPTETITITLSNPFFGYVVGSPSSATANLYDNDAVVITSVVKVSDVAEGGYNGQFLVTRTGDLSATPTVSYSIGGTATSGADYLAPDGSFTFVPGSATAGIFISALCDNLVEGDETVTFTLTSGTGYTISGSGTATLTIADDPPVITVVATDTAEGSATGGLSFVRTGGDLTQTLGFTYTIGGTATSGTDYTALSGSLSFAVNQDRIEVWVEAIGDDTNDDGETVTATLNSGTNYVIGSPGGSATVTIADQATTVSVVALNDGAEGGTDPKFRITRSGDVSGSLTVGFTVSGTATSGTDYTALSGSVTFNATDTYKDVTVSLTDDAIAEVTETITVTLDPPSSGYTLGNESDTVFVKDNDTPRVVWKGGASAGPNDWNVAANWTTNAVPTASDDVYFDGDLFNSYSCTNVGSSLSSPLYGMHIINGFSPLLILDKSLTVKNYEQQSAILNQPSARDLTVTDTMLWTGGTLDATASGAKVNIDGAVGRFDPPDVGGLFTSSTLNIVNNADVGILSGTVSLNGGAGITVNAKVKLLPVSNTEVRILNDSGGEKSISVGTLGRLNLAKSKPGETGRVLTTVPIQTAGEVVVNNGIHFTINGRFGDAGSSFIQTAGLMYWVTGSNIVAKFGMVVEDGQLLIHGDQQNTRATVVGDFRLGSAAGSPDLVFAGKNMVRFIVQGESTWQSGRYRPRLDLSIDDRWIVKKVFAVAQNHNAIFAPVIPPDIVDNWIVIEGWNGIAGNAPTVSPVTLLDTFELVISPAGVPMGQGVRFRPK